MPRTASGTRNASGTRSEASYTTSSGSSNAFLLMETGDFLLLETGDKIILDGISGGGGSQTFYRSAAGTRSAVT